MFKLVRWSDSLQRQFNDSVVLYSRVREALTRAQEFKGGMVWKTGGMYAVLVRTFPHQPQIKLGRRSDTTEKIYEEFTSKKHECNSRLAYLTRKLADAERRNEALQVGQAPPIMIDIFNEFVRANLLENVAIIGRHALYVYETAVNAYIQSKFLGCPARDLCQGHPRRLQLLVTQNCSLDKVAKHLWVADTSFTQVMVNPLIYRNTTGFEVELLHPGANDSEFEVLDATVTLEQFVVAENGRMAAVRTLAPAALVEYQRRLPQSVKKPALSSKSDIDAATVVEWLLTEECFNHGVRGTY